MKVTRRQLIAATVGAFVAPQFFSSNAFAAAGTRVVKIVGFRHKLALLSDGRLWAWGRLDEGQLGAEVPAATTPNTLHPPVPIVLPRAAVDVATADDVSLAVLDDGSVFSWGTGIGTGRGKARVARPSIVPGLANVTQIEGAGTNVLALTRDGEVMAWGGRGKGLIGDDKNPKRYLESGPDAPTPVAVPGAREVTQISALSGYVLALCRDGRVLSWGGNRGGALGRGEVQELVMDRPDFVEGLSGVSAVAASGYTAYALMKDGTVMFWGHNQMAQFGNGQRAQDGPDGLRPRPSPLAALRNVASISPGMIHTCVRQQDGTILGWGNSQLGEVGTRASDGYVKTPLRMGTSAASAVWAAGFNTFILRADGQLTGCGSDNAGWPFTKNAFQLMPIEQPWL